MGHSLPARSQITDHSSLKEKGRLSPDEERAEAPQSVIGLRTCKSPGGLQRLLLGWSQCKRLHVSGAGIQLAQCGGDPNQRRPRVATAARRAEPSSCRGGRTSYRTSGPQTRPAVPPAKGRRCRFRRGFGGGGAERDRTADLLIANEALSQLSYGPKSKRNGFWARRAGMSGGHLGPPPPAVNKRGAVHGGGLFLTAGAATCS